jgi:hypothetical protein
LWQRRVDVDDVDDGLRRGSRRAPPARKSGDHPIDLVGLDLKHPLDRRGPQVVDVSK